MRRAVGRRAVGVSRADRAARHVSLVEVELAVVLLIQQLLQYLRVVMTGVRRRRRDGALGVGAVVGPVVRQQVTYAVHFGAMRSRAGTIPTSIRSQRRSVAVP